MQETYEHLDGRAFSGSIWAQEPMHLLRIDCQVELVNSDQIPIRLCQILNLDRGPVHPLLPLLELTRKIGAYLQLFLDQQKS